MDVDQSSSSKRPHPSSFPPASSSKKREKDLLTDAEQTKLNKNMKLLISPSFLSNHPAVISSILLILALQLQDTAQRNSFIPPPSPLEALDIVMEFSDEEKEQWGLGVQNGINNNDWSDLIRHREYILDYQVI